MKVGTRITAATSALVAVTLGAYTALDLRETAQQRSLQMTREARMIAKSLQSSLEAMGVDSALTNADSTAQKISRATPNWNIALLPSTARRDAKNYTAQQLARLRQMLELRPPSLQTTQQERFIYVLPLRVSSITSADDYGISGTLEVSRSTHHLEEAWREDLLQALPLLIVIVLATILAITLLIRNVVTNPITQLLSGIDDVAQGDLSRVLLSEREDEIGELAIRFNEMTASLRESRAETGRQNEVKRQLEQRLSNTEKLATMGQLAAEIAHEVGTPLNVITGRARGLAKKPQDAQSVAKNATIIAEQTTRITRIIQRLIDVTRRKVGALEPGPVNLNKIVHTAIEFLSSQFAQAEIHAHLNLASELPQITGDPDRLQQIALNLLVNSIQAMPEGGNIYVETAVSIRRRPGLEKVPEQQYVQLCIRDTGIGIPPEQRGKIFNPFYSSKHHVGGTGLGLAVCHGIVKEHDGWIEIDDPPDGENGTLFRVYLPISS